jgi:hypothetical protein
LEATEGVFRDLKIDVIWKSVGRVNAEWGDRVDAAITNFGTLRKGTDKCPKVKLS